MVRVWYNNNARLWFRSEEDIVTEEQLEVERNGAVQQACNRGKADCFVLSSAVDSFSDLEHVQGKQRRGLEQWEYQLTLCSFHITKRLLRPRVGSNHQPFG